MNIYKFSTKQESGVPGALTFPASEARENFLSAPGKFPIAPPIFSL